MQYISRLPVKSLQVFCLCYPSIFKVVVSQETKTFSMSDKLHQEHYAILILKIGQHSPSSNNYGFILRKFIGFYSLRPSQQYFSYVGAGLPGLSQYNEFNEQGLMCLAHRYNAVMPVRLEAPTPRSRVKHSINEPLHSLNFA